VRQRGSEIDHRRVSYAPSSGYIAASRQVKCWANSGLTHRKKGPDSPSTSLPAPAMCRNQEFCTSKSPFLRGPVTAKQKQLPAAGAEKVYRETASGIPHYWNVRA
jgi:hypothetical protein